MVAADDITSRRRAGERVGLIGSNGAGKTTFVNMITGYLKPDAGAIALRRPRHHGACTRAQITPPRRRPLVPDPAALPSADVLENMLVALGICRERSACRSGGRRASAPTAGASAERLLERFGLAEHRERSVAELPGGVRKLLDIAMALTGTAAAAAARRADQRRLARRRSSRIMDMIMTAVARAAR